MPLDIKLSLVSTKIRSLKFSLRSEKVLDSDKKIPVSADMAYSYDYNYRMKTLRSILSVSVSQEELPFHLEIEFEGLFRLNKSIPERSIQPFARINCPAILFPFIRECIADITRRAGLSPLLLPVVNFIEIVKSIKERDENKETAVKEE